MYMKIRTVLLGLLYFSCSSPVNTSPPVSRADTLRLRDTVYLTTSDIDWQKHFGLTHDTSLDTIWFKPVSYYFSDPEFSGLAADYYYGRLRPSDDGATAELLKLATTDNDKLRPFYRWCLNTTIMIQDGALAEMTGVPARKYAEKFPGEFFYYIKRDSSRMADWAAAINYSGYYDSEDLKKQELIRKNFFNKMASNCRDCDETLMLNLKRFVANCFP